jgi:DNA-binding CsgD family transcriptional regulator
MVNFSFGKIYGHYSLLWPFFAIAMLISSELLGSDLFDYGTPYIQHFTKKEYKAGNKNWSITQDEDGFIYVGNSNGLLQFDGSRWTRYNLPKGTIVRSISAVGDRIYCGSLGELGYWEKDENFDMHYTSLTGLLDDFEFGDEEIWWIIEFEGNIIFQSFSTIFLYNGQKVDIILSDKGVIFPPFSVNGRLFIQVINEGIFELKGETLAFLSGSEIFINKQINAILPFSKSDSILIGTRDDGLFLYDSGNISVWQIESNARLKRDQLNRGIKLRDDLFAFGTLLGGVYVVDENGEVLNQINRDKGLNNNTVLSLFLDKKSNLWVGLDNGIDLIKVNSPVYYYTDVSGDIGSVYTSVIYRGDLYLGTNRGVFYTKLHNNYGNNREFTIIPGSQGQVWTLVIIDDQLFCGHNTSTFIINNYQLQQLSAIAGGYQISQYPYNDQYIVQGSYNGLSIYIKERDKWSYSHTLTGFSKLSKILEFERENVLWVAHTHKGLYRLELNHGLTQITESREFSSNSKTFVNKLNNKLVISSDSGFLYYDDIQNSFFPLEDINRALGIFAQNAHIIPAEEDIYWLFKDGDCARVAMDENSVTDIDNNVLNDLNEYLIPGYEDIYLLDSSYTFIYLDNGYAVYKNDWSDWNSKYKPAIFVRSLVFQTPLGKVFAHEGKLDRVPYRYNNVTLKLSYPEFAEENVLVYQLAGYDKRWIRTNTSDQLNFQNLSDGEYTIHVKPENDNSVEPVSIKFSINPPWYKSSSAKGVFAIFALISVVIILALYRRKIKKLHEKHELERQRLVQREAEQNEHKLIEFQNENLRNEIKLRNNRLAKSTFSLIHKNNTLIGVKEELIKIKEDLGPRFPGKHFNRLIRNIDKDLTSKNDWKIFEQSFNEVHEHFLHKLKHEYPDLTPSDIKLCAYLKMNLSSKEIATLLNITVRGVEVKRYRLRKKLHLHHETNLTEFIMGY